MHSDPRSAWLPLALPAVARRVRVAPGAVADALAAAGAAGVTTDVDVEIGSVSDLRGDAACAIVPLEPRVPLGPSRIGRVALRAARSAALRPRARLVARRLRGLGYPDAGVRLWELDWSRPLPLGALVVGRRSELPTVLDAALADAGLAGRRLLFVREGATVVVAAGGVLRVAIGPSRTIAGQRAALAVLRAASPPASVSDLVPWIDRTGHAGLGAWTRELRLPGSPVRELTGPLRAAAVDFLQALHALAPRDGVPRGPAEAAERVAEHAGAAAGRVRALGARLERELADLPRGFSHGDFHAGNLLAHDGALTGVVDWDRACPRGLPLLDLIHLKANEAMHRERAQLGPCLLAHVLPWARAGGDADARRLLDTDPATLERLVLAYWLDFIARDLEKSADRSMRPHWLEQNVALVAGAVA